MSKTDKKEENNQENTVDVEKKMDTDSSAPEVAEQPEQADAENDKFIKFTRKVTSSTEKAISSSYKKIKDAAQSPEFQPCAGVKLIDNLLNWARRTFPEKTFNSITNWSEKYGHASLLIAEVLTLIFFIIAGITINWTFFIQGIGFVALLIIAQYTADKFIHAGKILLKKSPAVLSSSAFLDCTAVLFEIVGFVIFLTFIITAKNIGLAWIWVGIGIWAVCDAIAYIALNPSMANTSISSDVSAGEEAIGIMSFFVNAIVKIAPAVFGIGSIIGALALVFAMITRNIIAGQSALLFIVVCACMPFASYIIFVFYRLVIDVLRAILILPRKLEKKK